MLDTVKCLTGVSRRQRSYEAVIQTSHEKTDSIQHRRLRGSARPEPVLRLGESVMREQVGQQLTAHNSLCCLGNSRQQRQRTVVRRVQERRNVTKSEGASKTSSSSRAKTNSSRKHFYADLQPPRLGESFSVLKLRLRKKGKILRII